MNILADTCFWFSLCDPTEGDHSEAIAMMEKLTNDRRHTILVPHPVLYETLCSKMVRKPERVKRLTRYFKDVKMVPDADYIKEAYGRVDRQANMNDGMASMVDWVIMLMADDIKNNVKGIITRNGRDFAVFCQKNKIAMIEGLEILNTL